MKYAEVETSCWRESEIDCCLSSVDIVQFYLCSIILLFFVSFFVGHKFRSLSSGHLVDFHNRRVVIKFDWLCNFQFRAKQEFIWNVAAKLRKHLRIEKLREGAKNILCQIFFGEGTLLVQQIWGGV